MRGNNQEAMSVAHLGMVCWILMTLLHVLQLSAVTVKFLVNQKWPIYMHTQYKSDIQTFFDLFQTAMAKSKNPKHNFHWSSDWRSIIMSYTHCSI